MATPVLAAATSRRRRVQDVVDGLRQRLPPHEVQQVVKLLDLLLEDTKSNLVSCNPTDFLKIQGEAQAYSKVMGLLTRQAFGTSTTNQE